jgi:biopolymer transport protein TolQ
MSQSVEEQILFLEKRMMFLATAVSASPFLGLFGTVWGITLAFTNLAIQGRADIQTLAPGVSGALLTTVIALFVAIPSLVGYNIIANSIKDITVRLDNFSENVAARLKIEQMESIQAYEKRNRE